MIYIAANEQGGRRTGLKEITKAIDSPEAFTAKILQQLVKGRLLMSHRGPSGGFELAKNRDILLYDVVKIIDGESLIDNCVLGLAECSVKNPCPVHDQFQAVKAMMKETLTSTKVNDANLLKGKRKLKL